MNDRLQRVSYEVEVRPGEKLTLPQTLVDSVGAGRWVITVATSEQAGSSPRNAPVRSHDAFVKGYSQEDEGLYDDLASG